MSAGVIETGGWLGEGGYGEFFMAFVYAGMILAGSFYLVTIAAKYLSREKIKQHQKPRAEKQTRIYHPLFNRNKNHLKVL